MPRNSPDTSIFQKPCKRSGVQVKLDSLVANGSFEVIDAALHVDGAVVAAPSSGIKGWAVEAGAVQVSLSSALNKTVGAHSLQPSTDGSGTVVGLNSETAVVAISTTFDMEASDSRKFSLLFDTAADPSYSETVLALLTVNVTAQPSGEVLAAAVYNLSSRGYTINSVGWETISLEFKAPAKYEDTGVKLLFMSDVIGTHGALLDNVQVYEILETGDYSDVGTRLDYGACKASAITIFTTMLTLGAWTGELGGFLDWL